VTLWSHRLIVVAGKGGVGRTSTSVCLALAAAARGLSVAVVELQHTSGVADLWGLENRSYQPQQLVPGVDTMSLSPIECLDDFGRRRLKLDALVRLVFHNRIMGAFLDAVPGLHDLLQLGKLRNLLQEPEPYDPSYDLLIVDAPATGHGLTLLSSARSMAEMTRVGPFFEEAKRIEEMLADPAHTALVLVTLPEELPVNESLELVDRLGPDKPLLQAVVVNQVLRDPLPPGVPWRRMREVLVHHPHPAMGPLLALADETAARHRAQARALRLLRSGLPEALGNEVTVVDLPYVPGGPGADRCGALAEQLGAAIDGETPQVVEGAA